MSSIMSGSFSQEYVVPCPGLRVALAAPDCEGLCCVIAHLYWLSMNDNSLELQLVPM